MSEAMHPILLADEESSHGEDVHQATIVRVKDWSFFKGDGWHTDAQAIDEIAAVVAFRETMPEELRPLLVGPIRPRLNMGAFFCFFPANGKAGWDDAALELDWRARFVDLVSGFLQPDFISVRWGGEHEQDPAIVAASAARTEDEGEE
jgi:hypothetical protein